MNGQQPDLQAEVRNLNIAVQKEPHRKRELVVAWYESLKTRYGDEQAQIGLDLLSIMNAREDPAPSTAVSRLHRGCRPRIGLAKITVVAALILVGIMIAYRIGHAALGPESEEVPSPYPSFWPRIRAANAGWYEQNGKSDTVFVFVHGIFSNSRMCWLAVNRAHPELTEYWPEIVRTDDRLEHPSIYLGGYHTSVDSGPYDMRQAANELGGELERDGVLNKPRLIFVTHSTGGIIVRFLLVHSLDLFKGKSIGLALYASPSIGSEYADTFGWLSETYHNALAKQLRPNDPTLLDLDKDFRDLLNDRSLHTDRIKLDGTEAVENYFIIHRRWFPDSRFVVSEPSASRYFGAPQYIPQTDHFTIVKPVSAQDPSHLHLVDFYRRLLSTLPRPQLTTSNLPAKDRRFLATTEAAKGPIQELLTTVCALGVVANGFKWEIVNAVHGIADRLHDETTKTRQSLPADSPELSPLRSMQTASRELLQNSSVFPSEPQIRSRSITAEIRKPIDLFRSTFLAESSELESMFGHSSDCGPRRSSEPSAIGGIWLALNDETVSVTQTGNRFSAKFSRRPNPFEGQFINPTYVFLDLLYKNNTGRDCCFGEVRPGTTSIYWDNLTSWQKVTDPALGTAPH